MSLREKFEKWVIESNQDYETPQFLIERNLSGDYSTVRIQGAWQGYKASRFEVPEGYCLVPLEPTIEMIAALGWGGDEVLAVGHGAISGGIADDYRAMLEAAPVLVVEKVEP